MSYPDRDVWPFRDSAPGAPVPFLVKVGREVLDPLGRVVTIVAVAPEHADVRLAGSYGATVRYPRSCLHPIPV